MLSYEFYKWLHLSAGLVTFGGLFTYLTLRRLGFTDGEAAATNLLSLKKVSIICHGVGLVLLLISGFGLAAKLGLAQGLPFWVFMKLGIWLIVGAVWSLIKRKNNFAAFY
ncbi:MAG: hypothetical protein V4736_12450, partial [Bdellovibrionota bacterium]